MSELPIRVQGLGIATSLGRGLSAQVAGLRQARPAVSTVPRCVGPGTFPFHAVGDGNDGSGLYRRIEQVVADAIADAGLSQAEVAQLGIFVGTTSLDLGDREVEFVRRIEGSDDPRYIKWGMGLIASRIAAAFGILGPHFTFSTACSSSGNALIYAARLLRAGRLSRALVVGTEHLNFVSLHGFDSMMLLSKTVMRPFDERRDGVELGEGTAAVVLGPQEARNGNLPSTCFMGAASNIDPQGITCSSPERTAEVIVAALKDAGASPAEIVAVKAHGVGTPAGDRSEGLGLLQVFAGNLPPVVSFKPSLGHTLGACAVVEMACLMGCVQERLLPATPGFEQADPAIGCEPLRAACDVDAGLFLLNNFGFGGNNTALVFSIEP